MPLNGFNVGRDIALDIIDSKGPVRFGLITGFDSKPLSKEEEVTGIDGVTRYLNSPKGYQGAFDIERQGSELDKYFAQMEADFYAGKNTLPCMIQETIQNPNGGYTTFRYVGVVLKFDDAGSWKGTSSVKQKVSFKASRRELV